MVMTHRFFGCYYPKEIKRSKRIKIFVRQNNKYE